MANAHQKFTGINLHGPEQPGTGTWKSLCGESNTDIIDIFYDLTGDTPTDEQIGEAKWLLGGAALFGEPVKCSSLDDYASWVRARYGEPDAPVVGNGLRHDWRTATAAWLYPGNKAYWIASHRMMLWDTQKIAAYLALPEIAPTSHVLICLNLGNRPSIFERPFDGLKHPDQVRKVFQQVIDADKAPLAFCMSQEFFLQSSGLGGNHSKLLEYLEESTRLVADLCHFALPMRELGDVYGGTALQKRTDCFLAMRRGAPDLPLAEHERSLEEIPVQDFRGVGGTIISGLQTGFDTPTGGQNRPQDRIRRGHSTYDGAAGFLRANGERMARYVNDGQLEDHVNAVFEHSLPLVYRGQSWQPTRTFMEAQARGQTLLQHGAAFDLSSGAKQ